jgi:hypothetical protein
MTHPCWFTLIAPGLDVSASAESASDKRGLLAKIAGRGRVRRTWDRADVGAALRPWQRGLVDALGLSSLNLASAPLTALGSGFSAQQGFWLHAEPVHLIAGLDRLTFVPLQDQVPLTLKERSSLAATLASQFPHNEFSWHATPTDWFVRADRSLDVTTSTPDAAALSELRDVVPQGRDGARLRSLMTELQMVLHEHPANDERELRGLPTANAIWLWGAGSLENMQALANGQQLPASWADDAFSRGVYQHFGGELHELTDPDELLESACMNSRALAVATVQNASMLETKWIERLLRAMSSRKIDRVDLVLDEWHIEADRAAMRRFWRQPLPVSQWKSTP